MTGRDAVRLGVNVDHVATLRQARLGATPDPVDAALVAQRSGASSIVCHLREDRRHIQEEDVRRLLRRLDIPLNLEMAIAPDIVACALRLRPAQVTLVPERRRELTTEGGLDARRLARRLSPLLSAFRAREIAVSLFVDPHPAQIAAAASLGVTIVELHTGAYANAKSPRAAHRPLQALREEARHARALGLAVAAGHGLDAANVRPIVEIPEIEELNIGFALISRALAVGLAAAVTEMAALLDRSANVEPEPHAARAT